MASPGPAIAAVIEGEGASGAVYIYCNGSSPRITRPHDVETSACRVPTTSTWVPVEARRSGDYG